MAARMKKMFHRKKDEDLEEPRPRSRAPATASRDPAIRTSLYESTAAGGPPQTGDYPIRGNDSSVMLQSGRKSSIRSMRSSSRGSHHNTSFQAPTHQQNDILQRNPPMSPPPFTTNDPRSHNPHDPYQDMSLPMSGQDNRQRRMSRSPLPQQFAGLNLGNGQGPTTVTSTVTTTSFGQQGPNTPRGTTHAQAGQGGDVSYGGASRNIEPQSPYANRMQQAQGNASKGNNTHYGTNQDTQSSNVYANRNAPQKQESPYQAGEMGLGPASSETQVSNHYSERGNTQARGVNSNGNAKAINTGNYQHSLGSQPGRNETSSNHRSYGSDTMDGPEPHQDLAKQKSISRKQVGTSSQAPYSPPQSLTSSSPQAGHNRQRSGPKPLPAAPILSKSGYDNHDIETKPKPVSILDRSRPIGKGHTAPRDGQDVVDRAKSNTYDTEVIEKIAPAVVHENVTKNVRHIREEVITREVHTHDVYHRILPIVDIEVLPPRHFLPVEGGGLVEVSAAEVPGRGHNWVIAETASKIASDQPAPHGRRQFTARQFPGQEGDAIKYTTPEGHEKTEETWVHPPELEEGARLTGQSWPMVFGDDNAFQASNVDSTPNLTSRKSPKKGQAIRASPAQRSGGASRTMQ